MIWKNTPFGLKKCKFHNLLYTIECPCCKADNDWKRNKKMSVRKNE